MILGVGLDVVDVAGFAAQVEDAASGFVEATFRPVELRALPADREQRAWHLAGRFAAKEAFVKAWSASRRGRPPQLAHVDLRDIEVVDDGYGRPGLRLHGEVRRAVAGLVAPVPSAVPPPAAGTSASPSVASEVAGGVGPVVHVSISHDGGVAVATVILES